MTSLGRTQILLEVDSVGPGHVGEDRWGYYGALVAVARAYTGDTDEIGVVWQGKILHTYANQARSEAEGHAVRMLRSLLGSDQRPCRQCGGGKTTQSVEWTVWNTEFENRFGDGPMQASEAEFKEWFDCHPYPAVPEDAPCDACYGTGAELTERERMLIVAAVATCRVDR